MDNGCWCSRASSIVRAAWLLGCGPVLDGGGWDGEEEGGCRGFSEKCESASVCCSCAFPGLMGYGSDGFEMGWMW